MAKLREKLIAPFFVNIAFADGELQDGEMDAIVRVAVANGLDAKKTLDAGSEYLKNSGKLQDIAAEMTEEEKDLAFFGSFRIVFADGKVTQKELQRLHAYCDLFGWGPAYATLKFLQLSKKVDNLKIEGLDF